MANRTRNQIRSRSGVLILTFPPDANPNYGGILQAWALQQTLRSAGIPSLVGGVNRGMATALRQTLKRATARLAARASGGRALSQANADRLVSVEVTAPILRFARRRIDTVGVFGGANRLMHARADRFSGYVVGSDQVWRPEYADTLDYMLDFLTGQGGVTRVAYAASFGVDDPQFDSKTADRAGRLLEQFDAISVREDSGVEFVSRRWGLQSERMIDPTMLLTPSAYRALAMPQSQLSGNSSPSIASYLLDTSPGKLDILREIEKTVGLSASNLMPPRASTYSQYARNEDSYRYPSVEQWLTAIAKAKFLVTDSFHGCVFAILFNVPFAVIPNASRGTARFETLLRIFGLEDRMLADPRAAEGIASSPIDWQRVNAAISAERRRARAFLNTHLGHFAPAFGTEP